ncbi:MULTISPECIES: hypothetical protein [Planktothrix]|uniref:hypothetical protein n=1 Tax=Planktothrix TaxID=54304 RepID=UPI0004220CC6|nr:MULTISPECIES: hypothetical protein [Planktothrix]CAD0226054.1 conserved hypothetical protein [Planktothrix agardhii]CAD5950566.1 hypothetical protein NO758_02507 [Planktothrix agardhii]
MSHNFNWKSFLFYAATIASVLILFKGVTAYGETQLKAPVSIGGDYSIEFDTPPNCLKDKDLTLKIEQSGIYIFANLVVEKSADNLDKIPLSGKFKEPEMILSGNSNPLLFCSSDLSQNPNQLTLTGEFKEKIFIGKIQDQTLSKPINFTAKINSVSPSEKSTH